MRYRLALQELLLSPAAHTCSQGLRSVRTLVDAKRVATYYLSTHGRAQSRVVTNDRRSAAGTKACAESYSCDWFKCPFLRATALARMYHQTAGA
eukprot:2417499-Pleurochrysis_carterae.AAC.2